MVNPATKRGQERDEVSLKAELTNQGKSVSGEVMNISIGGAQVRVKDEFGSDGYSFSISVNLAPFPAVSPGPTNNSTVWNLSANKMTSVKR